MRAFSGHVTFLILENKCITLLRLSIISFLLVLLGGCDTQEGNKRNIQRLDSLGISQAFTIDAGNDTTLFGNMGTRIYFPGGIWVTRNGDSVIGAITLVLKEIYNYKITDSLNNVAELEFASDSTHHLIYLSASAGLQPIAIKNNNFVTVHLPKGYGVERLQLSYLVHSGNNYLWVIDSTSRLHSEYLRMIYERKDFLKNPRKYDLSYKRLWFKDTSAIKTVENYFYKNFNFEDLDYRQMDTIRPHIDVKVSNTGMMYNIRVTRTSDSTFTNRITRFIQSLPPVDLYREKPGDTSSVEVVMTFRVEKRPLWFEISWGYLSSLMQENDANSKLSISSYSTAAKQYYIFNAHKTGWIRFVQPVRTIR